MDDKTFLMVIMIIQAVCVLLCMFFGGWAGGGGYFINGGFGWVLWLAMLICWIVFLFFDRWEIHDDGKFKVFSIVMCVCSIITICGALMGAFHADYVFSIGFALWANAFLFWTAIFVSFRI